MGLLGGVLKIGSSIFGGISASKAMKKAKAMTERELQENQSWYDRRYNEDVTQRADAQRILAKTEQMIKDRNRRAASVAAVMGGSEESVANEKAAGNEAMAEAVSQIALSGERRKDAVEQQYMQNKSALNEQLRGYEVGKANAMAAAVKGAFEDSKELQ